MEEELKAQEQVLIVGPELRLNCSGAESKSNIPKMENSSDGPQINEKNRFKLRALKLFLLASPWKLVYKGSELFLNDIKDALLVCFACCLFCWLFGRQGKQLLNYCHQNCPRSRYNFANHLEIIQLPRRHFSYHFANHK